MKNLVLFVTILLLVSCASRVKLISKSWRFNDVEIQGSNSDSATLAFQNRASEQMKTNLNIELNADSSYTIMQLSEGTAFHGKWWFSADKKVLFTKTDLGLNQYSILKPTKSRLVYESKDPVTGQILKITCVPIAGQGSK